MINTLAKNNDKLKISYNNVLNDIYLLPRWEKIASFKSVKPGFFLLKKSINLDLFRKFSSGNSLEKYSLRNSDGTVAAKMDLKVYKDCVYIITLDIDSALYFKPLMQYMLQVAVEKALYNTTEKSVNINLTNSFIVKNKMKHVLLNNGFRAEASQSSYEKSMFGETFTIKAADDTNWQNKIKSNPILINK